MAILSDRIPLAAIRLAEGRLLCGGKVYVPVASKPIPLPPPTGRQYCPKCLRIDLSCYDHHAATRQQSYRVCYRCGHFYDRRPATL